MNKRVKNLLFWAVTLLTCFLVQSVFAHQSLRDHTISLDSLLNGFRLEVDLHSPGATRSPANYNLILIHEDRTVIVKNMTDLQGAVKISSNQAALKFVRLRTSYATYRLWSPSPQLETEIVTVGEMGTIPNYGLSSYLDPRQLPAHPYPSGRLGILSRQAYQAGGFTRPMILKVQGGYEITRWIFVADASTQPEQKSVQQIREFVGEDGKYKRTILKKMKPPPLTETDWRFPLYG